MMKNFTLVFSFFFLSIATVFSQQLSGTIVDDLNDPIPGVSIVIEGTTKGTVTDINGQYTLNTTLNDFVLIYSFIGFSDYKVEISLAAGETKEMNVTLNQKQNY